MSQRPVVVGLFLCENVIVEEGTHNITLVNCFSIRAAERFPSEPLSFLLFATMTDGLGEMTFDVMIERLADLQEVYRRSSVVRLVDRLQEVRFKLQIALLIPLPWCVSCQPVHRRRIDRATPVSRRMKGKAA